MSLEDLLAANTKALQENTAALKAAAGGSAKGGSGSTNTDKASTVTVEQIVTVLTEIKEKHGAPAYKKVLSKYKATKSAELKKEDYAAVLKHAKAELTRLNDEAAAAEGDDDAEGDEDL